MDDADRGREAELARARLLIVRASSGFLMPPPSTELMLTSKVAWSLQVLQLLVEHAQALLRDFVRLDVVDADLQEVEARRRSAPRSASAPGSSRW